MPPRTPKQWPPVARITILNQAGQTITVSTNGTIPGKIGQGKNRTDSTLASWSLLWGDGQQEGGPGAPPLTLTHTYANAITSAVVRLAVVDTNTLTASATITVSLPGTTIAPPSAVTAVLQLANQVLLSWTYPTGIALQFQIYRAIGANAFVLLATVDGSLRQYTDPNLIAATTYTYAVAAVSASQTSVLSVTASVTTSTAPAAPTVLAAVAASASQIDLTWVDNASNEDGYQIERDGGSGFALIATVGASVTAFSDTGLAASTAYSYRVRAYNVLGASAYTNTASATTQGTVPLAPSSLSANAISATAINLQWTNNGPATTIRIERRIGAGAFSTLTSVSSSQSTFSDTGLTASTTYGYRLFAVNGVGDSPASNIAEATTLAAITIPAAPSALNGVAASPSQINLTWTDNSSNESGFLIERALGAGGAFAQVATVAAGVVAYSDSALAQSQLYRYQVRAYNSAGSSAASNAVSVTTLLAVPAAPTNLSAVATSPTAVHLAWTAPVVDSTHGTPATILVQRRISPAAFATIDTISASLVAYDDPAAIASTTYDYRLIAQNASGNSSASATASVTTPAALPTPPTAPSALAAVAVSPTRVNLTWTDNASNESGFVIQRAIGAGAFSDLATVNANVVSYVDNSVVASTTYNYRVYAYNGGGNSANSNTANVTTPAPAPPIAPSSLTAVPQSTTTIQLAWHDNSTDETGFSLERKLTGGVYTVIQTLAANVTTFLDTGLLPSTTYTYRIRAFSANGNSAYSNEAPATTLSVPPTPPTCTIGVDSQSVAGIQLGTPTTISLSATAGSSPIASWVVTFGDGTTQGGSGVPPTTLIHTYPVGTFNPILVVTDSNGLTGQDSGGPVNVLSGATSPAAPSNLTGSQTTPAQVSLNWQDNANNEDGFNVERKLAAASAYSALANTGANIPTYQDNTVTQGNTYNYRVRAFNAIGSSAYSNVISVGLSNGADYYVAPGGTDGVTHTGSISDPFATYAYALQRATAALTGVGKVIWGRGATYNQQLMTSQLNGAKGGTSWVNRVLLGHYPGETVWLRAPAGGPVAGTILLEDGEQYLEFDGINVDNSLKAYHAVAFGNAGFSNNYPHHIRYTNSEVIGGRNATDGNQTCVTLGGHAPISGGAQIGNYEVRGCNLHDSISYAVYVSTPNALVEANDLHDIGTYGVHIYNASGDSPDNNIVRNNSIRRILLGPFFGGAPNPTKAAALISGNFNQFYNNLCYDLNFNGDAVDTGAAVVQVYVRAMGTQLWNNTMAANVGMAIVNLADWATPPSGTIIRNNIGWQNTGGIITGSGTSTSVDHNSWDSPINGADPRFVDYVNRNLRLQAGSPCIDQGIPASFFNTDKDGVLRPQLSAWDIGAYEYHT